MRAIDIAFLKRFTSRQRTGTRPSIPEGLGDVHWNATSAILSLSNADASAWVEYNLSLLAGVVDAAHGGTGFTTYTKGDLLVGNAGGTLSKLAVGTDNQELRAASAETLGMKWVDPSTTEGISSLTGISNGNQAISDSNTTAITLDSFNGNLAAVFDVSVNTKITTTVDSEGSYVVWTFARFDGATAGHLLSVSLYKNGVMVSTITVTSTAGFDPMQTAPVIVVLVENDYLEVMVRQETGSSQNTSNAVPGLNGITMLRVAT